MDSTDEIERLITEWRAGVSEQAQRFDAARHAIDEVSVTETAAGGAIVVTVGSSGIPTALRLGDDVDRMRPHQVATQIMDCLRRAQVRLADRVGAVVAATVGADTEAAEAIAEEYRHRFPPPTDVDEWPAPTDENVHFGLSAMDIEPEPAATTPVHDRPGYPKPAVPARATPRAQVSNDDEDDDWAAKPW